MNGSYMSSWSAFGAPCNNGGPQTSPDNNPRLFSSDNNPRLPSTISRSSVFKWYRNHNIVSKHEVLTGKKAKKGYEMVGKIGIDWFPPANAIIHTGHVPRATSATMTVSTTKPTPTPDVGFRWDKTSDVSNRLGCTPQISYVVDVQDQGACGSCWAFSTAAVHTSRYRVWSHVEVPMLSPSVLLSCVTGTSQGCGGGMPDEAATYCLTKGLPTMECDDYGWCSAKTAFCQNPGQSGGGSCSNSPGGQCMCCDKDRPSCGSYGSSCQTCSCDGKEACSNPKCTAGTDTPDLYGWDYFGSGNGSRSGAPSDAGPNAIVQTIQGSYAENQQQIMDEIYQNGPVQANYFVMADFYGSTIGGSVAADTALWEETAGIYMNAPSWNPYGNGTAHGCQACETGPQMTPCQNASIATCMMGGHAVMIVGYGSMTIDSSNSEFSRVGGPIELTGASPSVVYYWVVQNSWGPDWNNSDTNNVDGISNGKWFHAMTGTYEVVSTGSSAGGNVKTYMVNDNLGLDHSLATIYGADGKSNGAGAKSLGGTFGGVLTWKPQPQALPCPGPPDGPPDNDPSHKKTHKPDRRIQPNGTTVDSISKKLKDAFDSLIGKAKDATDAPCIFGRPGYEQCVMIPSQVCTNIKGQSMGTLANCADALNTKPAPGPGPSPPVPPNPPHIKNLRERFPQWAIITVLSLVGLLMICIVAWVIWAATKSNEPAPFLAAPVSPTHNIPEHPVTVQSGHSSSTPTQIIMQAPPYPWPAMPTHQSPVTPTHQSPVTPDTRDMMNVMSNLQNEIKNLSSQTQRLQSNISGIQTPNLFE